MEWQTCRTQNAMERSVSVRVRPPAPDSLPGFDTILVGIFCLVGGMEGLVAFYGINTYHGMPLTYLTMNPLAFDEMAHQNKLHFFDRQRHSTKAKFSGTMYPCSTTFKMAL